MMEPIENLKDLTTYHAMDKIMHLLSKVSLDTFTSLTCWGEKLTRDPEVTIKHIREVLTQEDHPARHLFYRVFDTLSEYKRPLIFQSLFLNAWFSGGKKGVTGKKASISPTFHTHLESDSQVQPVRCKGCYTLEYGMKHELPLRLAARVFRDIRSRQPYNPNHLRPSMIIDNPHIMRDVIKKQPLFYTHWCR